MSAQSQLFTPVGNDGHIFTAQIGKLRCTAIRLSDGSLCLYSPVAGIEKAGTADLGKLGDVTFLLAPNHYHNKGLAEYDRLFPQAGLVCSPDATPRLVKQTTLEFCNLEKLEAALLPGFQILEPRGLKTGEVWIRVASGPHMIWIVADAFSAEHLPAGQHAQTPKMLGTFPKFGVKDKTLYKDWVKKQIAKEPPTMIIPCHGGLVAAAGLAGSLLDLLEETF
ncbi:hypothetical protein [Hoeflea prorocentri]|uniref:Uncharacterized protein n=1 Tax=Hoeflea prorocentri TaxID=1922333 RepID=A0A9X3UJU6_9HYPH|nr:hypothetical protein [Hoeflea prorocentri]MCY6380121.1 hypothetical protein [Hoeflea prorocentri]MDA5397921.1 hypothetical protein [Hoeflea prorocentri]